MARKNRNESNIPGQSQTENHSVLEGKVLLVLFQNRENARIRIGNNFGYASHLLQKIAQDRF